VSEMASQLASKEQICQPNQSRLFVD
jgi:hypothetical protein